MKRSLEWELLRNRLAGFKKVRRTYVGGALMARAWSAAVDYDPERDMLKYRSVDPRNVAFTPGFLDPHDPDCPVFIERVRMPTEQARRMKGWKNAEKLQPDDGLMPAGRSRTAAGPPGTVDFASRNAPQVDPTATPMYTTIAKVWYRFNPNSGKTRTRTLRPGERFMVCGSGCGYQSAPEGAGGEFPDLMEQECPTCGGDLKRAEEQDEPLDKLLVILPINQPWTEPLYEDEWPVHDCPTFPYLWLVVYDVPHKAIGPSDISSNWTLALTKNATVRLIWEQAVRSKAHYKMPETGVVDYNGLRYEFSEANGDVMFYNRDMPPNGVEVIQAAPVSSSLFQLLDVVEGAYKRYEGISDVAIAPGETRDIAASSLEKQIETGNVPADDFVDLLYDAESIFFTVIASYIRATYDEGKMVRYYGEDGRMMWKRMQGGALPVVDVAVSAGPTLDNVKVEQVDAYMKLINTPPQYRRGLARFMRFDPSVVRQIEQDDQQFQQQDPQMQAAMQQAKQQRFTQAMGGPPEGAPSSNGAGQGQGVMR